MSFPLTRLPVELMGIVVYHTIPESFEGVALSCKLLYQLCSPYLAQHKAYTKAFKSFRYLAREITGLGKHPIKSAFELLLYIAKDPVIARYIQEADFSNDCSFVRVGEGHRVPDEPYENGILLELLARSRYLQHADIDYETFFTSMQRPIREDRRERHWQRRIYSQNAAAFLLTLLPNLRSLHPPFRWAATLASDKILESIVTKSREAPSLSPSMGQTKVIRASNYDDYQENQPQDYLKEVSGFLTLANVCCFTISGYRIEGILGIKTAAPSTSLKVLRFIRCYLDTEAVSSILRLFPTITIFQYVHDLPEGMLMGQWNVASFLKAIEQSVGATLKSLLIKDFRTIMISTGMDNEDYSSTTRRCKIATKSTITMYGFPSLQDLEFPLELLSAIDTTSSDVPGAAWDVSETNLIPGSVLLLSFFFDTNPTHTKALDILLKNLAVGKRTQKLAIQEVEIQLTKEAQVECEKRFSKQFDELKDMGIRLGFTRRLRGLLTSDESKCDDK